MPRSSYTPDQLLAAQAGTLNRGNTNLGTPERSAVYHSELVARQDRGAAEGLTKAAALGHAPVGTATATDMREVRRAPERASVEQLQRVAVAHARSIFAGPGSRFDAKRTAARMSQQKDREVLRLMITNSHTEWVALAAFQVPNNPWWYH